MRLLFKPQESATIPSEAISFHTLRNATTQHSRQSIASKQQALEATACRRLIAAGPILGSTAPDRTTAEGDNTAITF
jgi:hypothetical protein